MAASNRLRILAFEPFDDGSHRQVRTSISRHSRHAWMWITRPGRAWKWRMRLAAAEMVDSAADAGALDPPPDRIVATSLMSASDLRALLPPALRAVPLILYMHENQIAYPAGVSATDVDRARDVQFALTNLNSALAADRVIWNSRWNRDSFFDGIERLLRHSPDLALPGWRDRIAGKSQIIWPPVEPPSVLHNTGGDQVTPGPADTVGGGGARNRAQTVGESPHQTPDSADAPDPVRVLWPHRWEHDKGPDRLLDIARQYTAQCNIRWTILGQKFRTTPPELDTFAREFADRIDHMGYVPDRDTYFRHLARCEWVCSTARHEFFGIAVVEALLAGCLPWLPMELSYPELLPDSARGLSPLNPPSDAEAAVIRTAIHAHLAPALAPNAVATLDAAIDATGVEYHRLHRGTFG